MKGPDDKSGPFFVFLYYLHSFWGDSYGLRKCDLYATLIAMKLMKIIIYCTDTGKEPFSAWQQSLDRKTRAIVRNRLDRIVLGNLGDSKVLKGGSGIWELRLDHGPGYRIYFGTQGQAIVILLTGGDKKSQNRDITKAMRYWLDYKETQ